MSNLLEMRLVRHGNLDALAAPFFCDTPNCQLPVKLLVHASN
jgi:hypothetical protein